MNDQPYNTAVTVTLSEVNILVNKMAMVICNVSYNSEYPQEEEAVKDILRECIDQYLKFCLPSLPKDAVGGFEFYVDEYFVAIKKELFADPQTMPYLNAMFAEACGVMGRQLVLAVRDMEFHGSTVEQIHVHDIQPRQTQMYILEGIRFEDTDIDEVVDERDL